MDGVRVAIGQWLGRWHSRIIPITPQMHEYSSRDLAKSVAYVPGRMIDSATDMLNLWMRNDTEDKKPTKSHKLPMVLVAIAPDSGPSGRDWGKNISSEIFVSFDADPKERVFAMRTQMRDVRVQMAFFAHEPDTAGHLMAQLASYMEDYQAKRFDALWDFAGFRIAAPVVLESDDAFPQRIPVDSKNMTIMTLDATFKVTHPMYRGPRAGEGIDGKGSGTPDDPHGFPLVGQVQVLHALLPPSGAGQSPLVGHTTDADGVTYWEP